MANVFERIKSFWSKESGNAFVSIPKSKESKILTEDPEDDIDKRMEWMKKLKRAYQRVPLITAIVDVQADQQGKSHKIR